MVASLGGGAPCLALNSHLDTVPAGPGWRDDPFRLRAEGDRLIGRGACDAKGSVAAMVEAACLLAACRDRWSGRLVAVFVADEEVGSTGAKRFAAEHPGVDRIVVGEPTGLRIVSAHKGCLRPRIRVHGRSAHSGTPQLGENAIIGAHRLIGLLEAEDRRLRAIVHPLVGPASLSVTRIAGGLADNVVPDACELTIDRRMLPGESAETVLPEVEAILERAREEAGVRTEILGLLLDGGPERDAGRRPDRAQRGAGRGPAGGRGARPDRLPGRVRPRPLPAGRHPGRGGRPRLAGAGAPARGVGAARRARARRGPLPRPGARLVRHRGRRRVNFLTDRVPSPIGTLLLVSDGEALRALDFDDYEPRMQRLLERRYGRAVTLTPARDPGGAATLVRAYLEGDLQAVERIPVRTDGTAFQERVWAALRASRPARRPPTGPSPRAWASRRRRGPSGSPTGRTRSPSSSPATG